MQESNRRIVSKELVRINIDSPLHCPHDMTKLDNKDNLPTLLNCLAMKDVNENILPLEQQSSSCKIFNDLSLKLIAKKKPSFTFLGPFERYKLIRPFLQAEAAEKEKPKEDKISVEDDPSVDDRIAAVCWYILEFPFNYFELNYF